jgi:hypothetical protein
MGAPCHNAFISRWKDSSAAFMRQTRNASFKSELLNSALEAGTSINWKATPSRTIYLLDIYISFCCLFFKDILQIYFKYIQKHHPFNISIKHLENIFIKTTNVRYQKC